MISKACGGAPTKFVFCLSNASEKSTYHPQAYKVLPEGREGVRRLCYGCFLWINLLFLGGRNIGGECSKRLAGAFGRHRILAVWGLDQSV